tara:strand:+ start:1775 stop:2443 length:669 start_codon:yes stop_codon:yes gene_type:complete
MKTFSQFCSEAVVLAKLKGVQGKLNKVTGKFTKGSWSDTESARYANAKPAVSTTRAVTPAPSPATPAVMRSPAAAPVPKPKDERPTNREVAAARKEAEYQKNARNLRLGVELGGIAADQARQNYANQNSPAARAAELKRQAAIPNWKKHQFTQDMPAPGKTKDRDYGIPTFRADRRNYNLDAMTSANRDAGMSPKDARERARRDEAALDKKNVGYQNYRNKK